MYAAGYLIIGAALFLYPFPRSFTLLVVVRLLFAAGAASAASMTSAGTRHTPHTYAHTHIHK